MIPATRPPPREEIRLLGIDSGGERTGGEAHAHLGRASDLPRLLWPGDVLVVNDAAAFPASLRGRARGADIEVRLLEPPLGGKARAVLFGAGDWRQRTENRPPPPRPARGDRIDFEALAAHIEDVAFASERLVELRFDRAGPELWAALYRLGRPVQYSHLADDLALWSVQTSYAARPWAAEMPSAGRPLSISTLIETRRRGIAVARLTHAAGLSATGEADLDAVLPLAEIFDIPEDTVAAIGAARAAGGRVIAVGTTVVRALEGAARSGGGSPSAGPARTDLVIGPDFRPAVVDGLVTGMHEPGESHYRLLCAFADESTLARAMAAAAVAGYRRHEFGDLALIVPGLMRGRPAYPVKRRR